MIGKKDQIVNSSQVKAITQWRQMTKFIQDNAPVFKPTSNQKKAFLKIAETFQDFGYLNFVLRNFLEFIISNFE